MGNNDLTLCMIVKNEEKMLPGCLESIQELVGQIIIVDTGSTDRTVEIAKNFGATIKSFPWTGDFSEARNESIKYADNNWILWLDADERLNPKSAQELKKIISNKPNHPIIYNLLIKNYQKGDYYYMSDAHRLFTNHFGIRFQGKIHEQVSQSLKAKNGTEINSDIEIIHHGYNLNPEEQEKKNKRNRKLLKEMVIKNPKFAYGYFTLAQNYAMSGMHNKAIEYFDKALNLNELDEKLTVSLLVTAAESLIEKEKFKKANQYINRALKIAPNQSGGYYLKYKIAAKNKDFSETERWLKTLFEKNRALKQSKKRRASDVIIDEEKILETLAKLYITNKNDEKYAETCMKILSINKKNKFANRGLLNYFIDNRRFNDAAPHLKMIEDSFTMADRKYLDTVGKILIKNGVYKMAIFVYDKLLSLDPENMDAVKKLVGLLAKIGRRDEAEKILIYYKNQKLKGKK